MRGRAIRWLLPVVVVGVAGVGAAMAADASMSSSRATVKTMKSSTFGTVLVSSSGRMLYRYTLDKKGVNNCTAVAICAKFWPQLLVKANAKPTVGAGAKKGLLGTIKAKGGMRQVTYAGFPLYFFAGDKKAGQAKGQGFDKQWYVVNTKGAFVKHAVKAGTAPAPAPTTTPSSGGGGSTWG